MPIAVTSMQSVNRLWSDVKDYEGVYEISNDGLVRRIGKAKSARVGRILNPSYDARGYKVVSLWRENKGKTFKIHRLVAVAFVPGDHSLTVNHIDGDKLNNAPTNLEWVTLAENTLHQHRTGLASKETCYKPSLIPLEDRAKIRDRVAAGELQKVIAAEYGCSKPLISWICNRARV